MKKLLLAILVLANVACAISTVPAVANTPSPRHSPSLRDYHALYDNRAAVRHVDTARNKEPYR